MSDDTLQLTEAQAVPDNVVMFPGCELPTIPTEPGPAAFSRYLKDLAQLIDEGRLKPSAAVLVLPVDGMIVLQRIACSPLETAGLLALAQRLVEV